MEELLSQDAPPGDSCVSKSPAIDSDTPLNAPPLRIGEMLVEAGLITEAQVAEALAKQATWGSRLGDIILAMGCVKPLDFYKVLARHFKLQFVNLSEQRVNESLLDSRDYLQYAQHLYLPWRRENGTLWIAPRNLDRRSSELCPRKIPISNSW